MKLHTKVILKMGIVVLVLSCLPQIAEAQSNLVYNGGFDISSNGSNPDVWTLTGAAYYNVKSGDPAPDVVLEGLGTASQTINSLNPGTIYFVSGDYQGLSGGSSTVISFEVALNGVSLFETASPTNLNWYSFNFEYAATSSSAVLNLAEINEAGFGYSIDNIAMYATPEPSAICLILLGSGLLICVRTRIRRPMGQRRLFRGACGQ